MLRNLSFLGSHRKEENPNTRGKGISMNRKFDCGWGLNESVEVFKGGHST
jgi:hypothetical protein